MSDSEYPHQSDQNLALASNDIMEESNAQGQAGQAPSTAVDEAISGGSVWPDASIEQLPHEAEHPESGSESGGSWHSVDDDDIEEQQHVHDDVEEEDDGSDLFDDDDDDVVDGGASACAATGFGCSHYQRNCRMVAPCCGKEYWCRHCHNEAEESVAALRCTPPTSHSLDRYAVKEVVCAQCDTRQPVSNKCTSCGIQFGVYFCSICNFWDHRAQEKKYYHCHGCGMCRVGGVENFVHCDECGHCISRQSQEDGTHVHTPGRTARVASRICSRQPGRRPHFRAVTTFTFIVSISTLGRSRGLAAPSAERLPCQARAMSLYIDQEIARTPLSREITDMFPGGVAARCYDCQAVSQLLQVAWHPFGLKCAGCGSYNTNSER